MSFFASFFAAAQTRQMTPKQTLLFALALAAALMVAIVLPRSLTFLPALAGVILAAWFYGTARFLPPIDKNIFLFLIGFLALGLLSALWSVEPGATAERAFKALPLFLAGLTLVGMARSTAADMPRSKSFIIALTLLTALAAGVIGFEYMFQFPLVRFLRGIGETDIYPNSIDSGFVLNRNFVFLILLLIPVVFCLYRSALKKPLKLGLLAILGGALFFALSYTESQTAQFIALLALVMAVYPSHWKIARYGLLAAILGCMLAAPFVIGPLYHSYVEENPGKPALGTLARAASIPHRLEVWNFISDKIKERPLLGHGLEATRFLESETYMPLMKTHNVMHPHNVVLQIWIELGLAGILLACAFVAYLFRRIDSMPPAQQKYYTALLVVILGMLSMAYGMWQAWQIGMIMAITAFSVMAIKLYDRR